MQRLILLSLFFFLIGCGSNKTPGPRAVHDQEQDRTKLATPFAPSSRQESEVATVLTQAEVILDKNRLQNPEIYTSLEFVRELSSLNQLILDTHRSSSQDSELKKVLESIRSLLLAGCDRPHLGDCPYLKALRQDPKSYQVALLIIESDLKAVEEAAEKDYAQILRLMEVTWAIYASRGTPERLEQLFIQQLPHFREVSSATHSYQKILGSIIVRYSAEDFDQREDDEALTLIFNQIRPAELDLGSQSASRFDQELLFPLWSRLQGREGFQNDITRVFQQDSASIVHHLGRTPLDGLNGSENNRGWDKDVCIFMLDRLYLERLGALQVSDITSRWNEEERVECFHKAESYLAARLLIQLSVYARELKTTLDRIVSETAQSDLLREVQNHSPQLRRIWSNYLGRSHKVTSVLQTWFGVENQEYASKALKLSLALGKNVKIFAEYPGQLVVLYYLRNLRSQQIGSDMRVQDVSVAYYVERILEGQGQVVDWNLDGSNSGALSYVEFLLGFDFALKNSFFKYFDISEADMLELLVSSYITQDQSVVHLEIEAIERLVEGNTIQDIRADCAMEAERLLSSHNQNRNSYSIKMSELRSHLGVRPESLDKVLVFSSSRYRRNFLTFKLWIAPKIKKIESLQRIYQKHHESIPQTLVAQLNNFTRQMQALVSHPLSEQQEARECLWAVMVNEWERQHQVINYELQFLRHIQKLYQQYQISQSEEDLNQLKSLLSSWQGTPGFGPDDMSFVREGVVRLYLVPFLERVAHYLVSGLPEYLKQEGLASGPISPYMQVEYDHRALSVADNNRYLDLNLGRTEAETFRNYLRAMIQTQGGYSLANWGSVGTVSFYARGISSIKDVVLSLWMQDILPQDFHLSHEEFVFGLSRVLRSLHIGQDRLESILSEVDIFTYGQKIEKGSRTALELFFDGYGVRQPFDGLIEYMLEEKTAARSFAVVTDGSGESSGSSPSLLEQVSQYWRDRSSIGPLLFEPGFEVFSYLDQSYRDEVENYFSRVQDIICRAQDSATVSYMESFGLDLENMNLSLRLPTPDMRQLIDPHYIGLFNEKIRELREGPESELATAPYAEQLYPRWEEVLHCDRLEPLGQ